MRKINSIVIDSVEPKNPEVLWISKDGLFICEGGVWVNILASNSKVTELSNKIDSFKAELLIAIDSKSSRLENLIGSLDSDIEGLETRIETLENNI